MTQHERTGDADVGTASTVARQLQGWSYGHTFRAYCEECGADLGGMICDNGWLRDGDLVRMQWWHLASGAHVCERCATPTPAAEAPAEGNRGGPEAVRRRLR